MVSASDRLELQTTSVTSVGDASSASEKLAAEYHLLGSLPGTIGSGIANAAKEAWDHKTRTAIESVSAVVLGAGFSLLSKNPNPVVAATTTWLGRAFIGVAAADLGYRFVQPMNDVWQHTSHLEADKVQLGNNIGDAVFNYGIAVGEGGLGAKLGERYLAPTKFGSFLQGFTETTIDGRLLNDPIKVNKLQSLLNPDSVEATKQIAPGFSGDVTLRTLKDGSQVAFDKNHVYVSTNDGAHMWFKHKESFLGLRDQVDLKRVVRLNEPEAAANFTDVFLRKGRLAAGLGPTAEAPAGMDGATYEFTDGVKLFTNDSQRVFEVNTPSARVFSPQRGSWRFNSIANLNLEDMPSPAVPKASTIGAVSTPKLGEINLVKFTSSSKPLEKGFVGALGQLALERAGDIGTAVFEHDILKHTGG